MVNLLEQLLSTSYFTLIICGSQFNLEISPEKYFGVSGLLSQILRALGKPGRTVAMTFISYFGD